MLLSVIDMNHINPMGCSVDFDVFQEILLLYAVGNATFPKWEVVSEYIIWFDAAILLGAKVEICCSEW